MIKSVLNCKHLQRKSLETFARAGPYNPYMFKDHFIPRNEPKYVHSYKVRRANQIHEADPFLTCLASEEQSTHQPCARVRSHACLRRAIHHGRHKKSHVEYLGG